MICPHCHQDIDDAVTICPHCDTRIDDAGSFHHEFIYCEGCGARLTSRDRTCPKCGRPAPGILSTEASASDLAAGKTASFPKLTAADIAARVQRPTAADVLSAALDPDATTSMTIPAESLSGAKRRTSADEDPYHRKKRPWGKVAAVLIVIALAAGGVYVVTTDPFGFMSQLYASIETAASEMFPSRWSTDASESADDADEDDATVEIEDDSILTDDEAYEELLAYYEEIGAYQDPLGDAVEAYNGSFLASSLARRQEAADVSYTLRDEVQETIDALDAITLAQDSVYAEDLEHLKSLAQWMYNRVDVLCQSWDIALSYADGENLNSYYSEISQPLRDALDSQGRNVDLVQFEENYSSWKPTQKS